MCRLEASYPLQTKPQSYLALLSEAIGFAHHRRRPHSDIVASTPTPPPRRDAHAVYAPLDLIIAAVNAGTHLHGVHVKYSLPSTYFAAVGVGSFQPSQVQAAAAARGSPSVPLVVFPCKEGHLLPYEDKLFDNYWSGFYRHV